MIPEVGLSAFNTHTPPNMNNLLRNGEAVSPETDTEPTDAEMRMVAAQGRARMEDESITL